MTLEEMIYSLAKDVEKLLQHAGELKSNEKHPVVNELDSWHQEDAQSSTPSVSSVVINTGTNSPAGA